MIIELFLLSSEMLLAPEVADKELPDAVDISWKVSSGHRVKLDVKTSASYSLVMMSYFVGPLIVKLYSRAVELVRVIFSLPQM